MGRFRADYGRKLLYLISFKVVQINDNSNPRILHNYCKTSQHARVEIKILYQMNIYIMTL